MKHFDFEKILDFNHLYNAYLASRRSKRTTREVIEFEMNAGANLCKIQEELASGNYRLTGYYHFTIHDPKVREIYALHYRDRIVQHSLCDNLLAPYFENHLIYDNAACRKGKGTLFAVNRLNHFLHQHYRKYGTEGYFLKCDIRKFFDNIDHEILKARLSKVVDDARTLDLLFHIIDSYEVTPGKGIPMSGMQPNILIAYLIDKLVNIVKHFLRDAYTLCIKQGIQTKNIKPMFSKIAILYHNTAGFLIPQVQKCFHFQRNNMRSIQNREFSSDGYSLLDKTII